MRFFYEIFSAGDLSPRGLCLLWRPELIWLHVLSDAVIGLAYYSIPLALAMFVWKRRDLAFGWIFWMFAGFILACGTTHFLSIWTLWRPDYGVEGLVKAMTAVVSIGTAVALWSLLPRALALPSPAALRLLNDELRRKVEERDQAVRELSSSEERFRAYFDHAAERLFVVDVGADGRFRYEGLNPVAERLSGITTEQARGRTPGELLSPATAELLTARYRECVRLAVPLRYEESVVFPSSTRMWETILVPIADASGRITKLMGSARDIDERLESEARLRHAQKLEAIGQLSGGIAHDFNNLLTVVLANLEIVRRGVAGDPVIEPRVEAAIGGAERGARLTRQLLAVARRQPLDSRALDLRGLVDETVALLRETLGERIVIETELPAELWQAFADSGQVESALLNLVLNARDAMPEGGRITIALANEALARDEAREDGVTPGDYVVLAVTDTGIGMAPEIRERAFDPFFTTKPDGQGSGLGLSMVYGFVKQSGGHAVLDSAPGRGTAVRLYLPRAADEALPGPVPAPAGDLTGRETILVVEDDELVREAVVVVLEDLGYRVFEAADGGAALAILEAEGSFDLLFTDVVMPGALSSRELAQRARTRHPDIKVLFTSGYSAEAIGHRGPADPDIQLLSKPYRREQLALKLRSLLATRVT